MTLLYTEVEEELRTAVRDLLADKAPVAAEGENAAAWHGLARDIGVAGLLVPEDLGGAGASAREAAVVLEELGRAGTPAPFLTSSVLATRVLSSAGYAGISRLASGEATAALCVSLAASPYRDVPVGVLEEGDGGPAAPGGPTVAAAGGEADGAGGAAGSLAGVVSGRFSGVAGAVGADLFVVPLDGGRVAVVESERVLVEPVVSLDVTRPLATVTFERVPAVVLDGGSVDEALLLAAGLLASEQVGVAEWCLTTTVAYLKERRQFARPVGSFQALKHRLADLWLEVAGARAAARNAADQLASGGDARVAVAVAAAHCGEVAVRAAEEALQLHGGIGMTWEHPIHLYLKRAKADSIAFGTPGDHRSALAPLVGLPGPE
ncbi:acyl-CoA dehydrogenase family protein [Herbidospora sp. NBRC 101105]|uniref:acyl-CoA dehydrogenase family protein n=1 Tax=Herbidospora sp. NBRC 101105 TaxID=3032195 RepID=UPI0024A1E908|nr:acyl-CoA dehydrogenase family protein [Herbidospora sp. NBRC 101105]GLX97785.1 acyl-CoA dehydrogenase [Herbidospora sp. NBRC 101105]